MMFPGVRFCSSFTYSITDGALLYLLKTTSAKFHAMNTQFNIDHYTNLDMLSIILCLIFHGRMEGAVYQAEQIHISANTE